LLVPLQLLPQQLAAALEQAATVQGGRLRSNFLLVLMVVAQQTLTLCTAYMLLGRATAALCVTRSCRQGPSSSRQQGCSARRSHQGFGLVGPAAAQGSRAQQEQ
jgi:hypothetical protein